MNQINTNTINIIIMVKLKKIYLLTVQTCFSYVNKNILDSQLWYEARDFY